MAGRIRASMEPAEIREYLRRDWELVRELKDKYWVERKRGLAPEVALSIGDMLRAHVREVRPEWPGEADRECDLRVHARVSACLRRVATTHL